MFIGEYTHTLDPKNRLSLPARFRKELGRAVVLTRGVDRCLFVYPKKSWGTRAAEAARGANGTAADRGLARLFLAGAMEVDIDGGGRVLLPEYLKSYAGIQGKVVVAGVADRIEIWEEDAWKDYTKAIERDAESYAEKVGNK